MSSTRLAWIAVWPLAMVLVGTQCSNNDGGDDDDVGGAGGGAGDTGNGGQGGQPAGGQGGQPAGGQGGQPAGGQGGQPAGGQGGMVQGGAGGMVGTGGMPQMMADTVCPASGNCKILCVGDTIAVGTGAPAGYRTDLTTRLKGHDKNAFEFVGSQGSGTNKHEGTADLSLDALSASITGLIDMHKPHIVIVNIGNEEAFNNTTITTIPTKIKAIVDKIRTAAPKAYILVSGLSRTTNNSTSSGTSPNARFYATDDRLVKAAPDWTKTDQRLRFVRAVWVNASSGFGDVKSVDTSLFTGTKYTPKPTGYERFGQVYDAALWRFITN